jgi:hypothetical protein
MSSAFSAFWRNLPENIQQPASIALLGSIGAHAFFFASLPAFTSSEENQDDPLRRVNVVELTPQEQSKLPPIGNATSTFGLPPVQQAPNAKVQAPQGDQATVPVPNNPLLYDIPGLSTQTLPSTQSEVPDNNALLKKYIAAQNAAIARRNQELKDLQTSENQPKQTETPRKTEPSQTLGQIFGKYSNTPIPTLEPQDPSSIASSQGQPSPNPSAPPETPASATQTPPATQTPASTTQTPPATQTPSPSPRQTLSPEVIERNRQLREFYASTQYNAANTDSDPRFANSSGFKAPDQDWLTWKTQTLQPALDRKEVELVEHPSKAEEVEKGIPTLPYPFPFAIRDFKQNRVVIAATVGTDGKLTGEPILFGKTGYAALDKAAIEHVKQELSKLPAPKKTTVHRFVFKYQPPSGQSVG